MKMHAGSCFYAFGGCSAAACTSARICLLSDTAVILAVSFCVLCLEGNAM